MAESKAYESGELTHDAVSKRRDVRSHYFALQNSISDGKDAMDSKKFMNIISKVEDLHQHVNKPREQVADAEALLELTTSLVASAKQHSVGGVTPSEFISCLLTEFDRRESKTNQFRNLKSSIDWKNLGTAVSSIFMDAKSCKTMLGPMSVEFKRRRIQRRRTSTKLSSMSKPKELENAEEENTDTDKNMVAFFEILKKKKSVKLENLLLNRNSFSQTIENIFALSFLAKDGRVEIKVDEDGSQLVSPRNAPDASQIQSGEAKYSHFMFKFDYNDWEMLKDIVPEGEELMPHREYNINTTSLSSQATPDKILSRDRTLLLQEKTMENSHELTNGNRNCKRKLL